MKTFAQLPKEVQAVIKESIHVRDEYTILEVVEMLQAEVSAGHLQCMNSDEEEEQWYAAQNEGRALNALDALEPYL